MRARNSLGEDIVAVEHDGEEKVGEFSNVNDSGGERVVGSKPISVVGEYGQMGCDEVTCAKEENETIDIKFRGSEVAKEESIKGGVERDVGSGEDRRSENDEIQKIEELKDETKKDTKEKILKRKRGRPRKSSICDGIFLNDKDGGSANRLVGEGSRGLVVENLVEGGIESVQKSGKEINSKRGRGRPPKKQSNIGDTLTYERGGNLVCEGSVVENLVKGDIKLVHDKKSEKGANSKRGRGRPPKEHSIGDTLGSEGVRDVNDNNLGKGTIIYNEVEDNGKEMNLKMKRGRPRKLQISDVVAKNIRHCDISIDEGRKYATRVKSGDEGLSFIPEEELGTLARTIVKQREYKGKKKDSVEKSKTNDILKPKKHKDKLLISKQKKTMLAWLIDSGALTENIRVRYMYQKGQHFKREGSITRDGIKCDCCAEIFKLSEFEKHAGSELCQPYQNIYLESGASLLDCQLDSWRKEEEFFKSKWFHLVDVDHCEDPNDEFCNQCGGGFGHLICCDGCPSTFHLKCIGIDVKDLPLGDWQCFQCRCKFCLGENASTLENIDNIITSTPNTCRLCEEKYHIECVKETSAIENDTTLSTFCGSTCEKIFEKLQLLLGVKQQLEEGLSWRLIQRTDVNSDLSHHKTQENLECNLKLAIALSIMNESFLPLVDHKSGANLMRNIVYSCGSNLSRLNYTGFYTAILERDDEMIAVAFIRIHGCHFAEMPFITVSELYRRQGMCRRLLGAIEYGLSSLHVEKLIISSVTERKETWTKTFGFKPLECSNRLQMRNKKLLIFPETDMMEKSLI